MFRHLKTLTTVAAALALGACGGDDDPSGERAAASTTTTQAGTAQGRDAERYCGLVERLDAAGEKFFSDLGEDAEPKDFEKAERRFIEQHAQELSELEQVAPPQIARDVDALMTAMRQRAGIDTTVQVTEKAAQAAERRVKAFEKRAC